MKIYQLIIQIALKIGDVSAFDSIVSLEERLSNRLFVLHDGSELDGHDVGMREANIFIITPNAADTFRNISDILTASVLEFKAAYRDLDDDTLTTLWPPDLETFDVT